MRKTLMATVAMASLLCGGAHAASLQVSASDGHMNIRSGPGSNYALIASAPNGTVFTWHGEPTCAPRQDGIRGADWCKVNYNGQVGWVSRAGLMPTAEELPDPQPNGTEFNCGAPQMFYNLDRTPDYDPVVSIEVSHHDHSWRIIHHLASGLAVSRGDQYAIADASNEGVTRWDGTLYKHSFMRMVGEVRFDQQTKQVAYVEWLYNMSQGGRLEMKMGAYCQIISHDAPPVVVHTVPVPVVPVAPVQQNAPVVVTPTPNNNITITVVPGTTYSPQPKKEEEKSGS